MLSILLGILKIIGIVIGCLLLFLLIVIAGMLFVPVRYVLRGEKRNGADEESFIDTVKGSGRITWFFHFISVKIKYDNEMNMNFKILGIPVYDHLKKMNKPVKEKKNKKPAKHKKKKNKNKKKKRNTDDNVTTVVMANNEIENNDDIMRNASCEEVLASEIISSNSIDSEIISVDTVDNELADYEIAEKEINNKDANSNSSTSKKKTKKVKTGKQNKILLFFRGIVEKIKNIKYTFKKLYDKMINVQDTIVYYKELMKKEETKNAFSLCKKQISTFIKHIRPKKIRGNVTIGFNDPGTTGQIFGYLCMLYPVYGNSILIVPDFEQEILEGNVLIKGRVQLFVIVKIALKLMFNKNLKRFISLLKREDM